MVISRGESRFWAHAVRAASITNGTAAMISHAVKIGLPDTSSSEPAVFPELPVVGAVADLFSFLNIMESNLSAI